MRRRKRHIEIFSISALDLFASAMGAFILIAIILFPYYLKGRDADARIEAASADLDRERADARERLAADDATVRDLRAGLAREQALVTSMKAQAERARQPGPPTFLVVLVRWSSEGADVDLHVTDPAGNEFYWFKTNAGRRDFPSSPAEFSLDMTRGPGLELWQDPAAAPGEYKVDMVANVLPAGTAVQVLGTVYDRSGRHDLPLRSLHTARERVRAAVITVEPDGHVALH